MSFRIYHMKICTHPLSNAVTIVDNLYLLPQNTVSAPASDAGACLNSKHQKNDEGYKHQEAKDDCYGLQRTEDQLSVSCQF